MDEFWKKTGSAPVSSTDSHDLKKCRNYSFMLLRVQNELDLFVKTVVVTYV